MTNWELIAKIDKIVEDNCKEVPYEGTEIDKYSMKSEFIDLLRQLSYSDLYNIQKEEV